MIPNIHQSIEEIIKSAPPQQKILWQQIRLLTGENAAIRQLSYIGPTLADFTSYSANKLFLAIELDFSSSVASNPSAAAGLVAIYDQTNTISGYFANNAPYWDATAAAPRYMPNNISLKNYLFSRILFAAPYNTLKFIGYKIAF